MRLRAIALINYKGFVFRKNEIFNVRETVAIEFIEKKLAIRVLDSFKERIKK